MIELAVGDSNESCREEELVEDDCIKGSLKESVEALIRTLDENFESFDSATSSIVLEILGAMDAAETS